MSLEGGRQLKARLGALSETKLFLGRVGLQGVANAKHRVHRRTGNLGRTIRLGNVTDDYAEVRAGGQRKVGYAAAEEFGSRPRVIRPRRKQVLAWGGARTLGGRLRSGSSATHFAREVRHPGTKAHPYLRPGVLDAVARQGGDVLVDIWNEAA